MEKEPIKNSERFKVMLTTVLGEIALFFVAVYGLDIDIDAVLTLCGWIAVIVTGFIYGRSIRNTPTPQKSESAKRDFEVVGK